MPCHDVTEIIRITLDENDCIEDYALIKRTCGQGVGHASLLLEWLRGDSIDAILAIEPDAFLETHGVIEEIEAFLTLKHLFAIQAALNVLIGQAPGGPEDACAAAAIHYDAEKTFIDGRIAVDILTERIKSCGGCKGCGKARAKKARATSARNAPLSV